MSQIRKQELAAKKEAKRAIQYPRVELPVVEKMDTILDLSYKELQAMAKSRGLKASGSKVSLIERLS